MRQIKWIIIPLIAIGGWYLWSNRNSTQMTTKQKVIRMVYPLMQLFTGKKQLHQEAATPAPVSFYSLKARANNGTLLDFSTLRNKKVLLVNTASECGYTPQYKELQSLYERYRGKLEIIAFPANDFKEQEKGDDAAIASFCQRNYGVSFPLMQKSVVLASPEQQEVFRWLTDKNANGWNEQVPEWNFSKYLINEQGELTHYFAPGVSPLSPEMIRAINE